MTSPTDSQRRHDELRDLLTEIRDRLPESEPREVNTPIGEHHRLANLCERHYCEYVHDPEPVDYPDEALVDKADEDSTVRPGLYVGGRRVGAVAGSWEWGADGEWHRTSHDDDPDEALAKVLLAALDYGPWDDQGDDVRADFAPWDDQGDDVRADFLTAARAAREHVGEWAAIEVDKMRSRMFAEAQRADRAEAMADECYAQEDATAHDRAEEAEKARAWAQEHAASLVNERDEANAKVKKMRDRLHEEIRRAEQAEAKVEEMRTRLHSEIRRVDNAEAEVGRLNRVQEKAARAKSDPDHITVTLPTEGLTEPSTLRLAATDLRRNHTLGFWGLPRSLPGTLDALSDAIERSEQS